MRRSFLRQALVALAVFLPLAIFHGVTAQAATFSFTDANCSSFGLTDNGGGNFTLTCQSLQCSIAATKPSPGPSDPETLTATCVGASANATYTWTAGAGNVGCPAMTPSGNTASLPAPNATVANCVYKLSASDGANGGGSAQINLNYATLSGTVPSSCTLSANPSSLATGGGQTTLTMTCTGGDPPTTVNWSAGAPGATTCDGVHSCTASPTIAATTQFTGTAANGAGSASSSKSTTVSVQTGGGGGGGGISCAGFTNTLVIDVTWPANGSLIPYYTSQFGGFGPNDAVVMRFTASAAAASTGAGVVKGVEFQSPPANRVGSLSTTPCDFTGGVQEAKCFGAMAKFDNSAPSLGLTQGTSTGSCKVALQPGVTYYLNLFNENRSCGSTACDMVLYFQKPSGT
jgi:hypothetical protein